MYVPEFGKNPTDETKLIQSPSITKFPAIKSAYEDLTDLIAEIEKHKNAVANMRAEVEQEINKKYKIGEMDVKKEQMVKNIVNMINKSKTIDEALVLARTAALTIMEDTKEIKSELTPDQVAQIKLLNDQIKAIQKNVKTLETVTTEIKLVKFKVPQTVQKKWGDRVFESNKKDKIEALDEVVQLIELAEEFSNLVDSILNGLQKVNQTAEAIV